ncbi:hypothetical protein SS50377_24078 [Spironucleus salmonicida]|uniref:Uncharacterized protein n=1 Tax=Spironucleus salmonicida TaxID=348837 RepID=A0A9P8RZ23_9EUKA|nr:hypothetical protein SS50377_24078 [Spironucleus salmonicida]
MQVWAKFPMKDVLPCLTLASPVLNGSISFTNCILASKLAIILHQLSVLIYEIVNQRSYKYDAALTFSSLYQLYQMSVYWPAASILPQICFKCFLWCISKVQRQFHRYHKALTVNSGKAIAIQICARMRPALQLHCLTQNTAMQLAGCCWKVEHHADLQILVADKQILLHGQSCPLAFGIYVRIGSFLDLISCRCQINSGIRINTLNDYSTSSVAQSILLDILEYWLEYDSSIHQHYNNCKLCGTLPRYCLSHLCQFYFLQSFCGLAARFTHLIPFCSLARQGSVRAVPELLKNAFPRKPVEQDAPCEIAIPGKAVQLKQRSAYRGYQSRLPIITTGRTQLLRADELLYALLAPIEPTQVFPSASLQTNTNHHLRHPARSLRSCYYSGTDILQEPRVS